MSGFFGEFIINITECDKFSMKTESFRSPKVYRDFYSYYFKYIFYIAYISLHILYIFVT